MNRLTIAASLVLCFAVPNAPAQMRPQMGPQIYAPKGIFNPVVGIGAQYEIAKQDGSKVSWAKNQ
jgi:hypothetical protein